MNDIYTHSRSAQQKKQMHYSPNLLNTVNNSIDNCKVVTIEYDSHEKGVTIREVEPMAIVYKDRKRNLIAWCRLRNDYRSFRLDRLNCIKLKNEEFARRQDFQIENFQDDSGNGYVEESEDDN